MEILKGNVFIVKKITRGMESSRITRNFQVTLPKDIRKLKNLQVGDEVLFIVDQDRIELIKKEEDPIMAAAGLWKGMKETGVQYQKRLRKEWSKRQQKLS